MKMYPQTVIEHFKKHFGEAPELVARAPGRINLIGEHTDYNLGFVLPGAIDKAIWFAAGRRSDGCFSLQAVDLEDSFFSEKNPARQGGSKTWANYLLGVVAEARAEGLEFGGLNVVFGGDVPIGAGLSSSAAVESGMVFCLDRLWELGLTKLRRVLLAKRAENNFVGMQCGVMDMFASVNGRAGHVIRLDCRSLESQYFPFDSPDFTLILCDTGVKHALVDSEFNTRRAECERGVALLREVFPGVGSLRDVSPEQIFSVKKRLPEVIFRRCKFVTEEIRRVEQACDFLKNKDLEAFGQLMFTTHAGLMIEYAVSCPELDFLVMTARMKMDGAVAGARMMGAGFGGCTLNLVRRDASKRFEKVMKQAFLEKFGRKLPCYEVRLMDGVGEWSG